MEAGNNNPTVSQMITPEQWSQMTPQQKAGFPAEVQNLMNQQEALLRQQQPVPIGTMPLPGMVPPAAPAPAQGMTPNQDVAAPPAAPQAPAQQAMALKDQKALLKDAETATGCARSWYDIHKVDICNQHDLAAVGLGVLIGAALVGGVWVIVSLCRKG